MRAPYPTLVEVVSGERSGVQAFLDGALTVRGNLALALQLDGLFPGDAADDSRTSTRSVHAGGIETFYLEAGPVDAPTVVLVHGFSLSMQSWVLQRRALIHSGFRVVSYDQRGHGRSGQPALENCTVAQLGRDLAAVMDATCTSGPVVLVGHSMGGMTVMSYIGQHPDVIRERVLAVALMVHHRRELVPTLVTPFRRTPASVPVREPERQPELVG